MLGRWELVLPDRFVIKLGEAIREDLLAELASLNSLLFSSFRTSFCVCRFY